MWKLRLIWGGSNIKYSGRKGGRGHFQRNGSLSTLWAHILVYSGTLSPFIKVGTWEIGKSLGRKASCQVHTEYGPKSKLRKEDYFHNRSPLLSKGQNLGMGPEFQGHKPQDRKLTWHSGHTHSLLLNRQLPILPFKLHIHFKRFLLVLEKTAYKFSHSRTLSHRHWVAYEVFIGQWIIRFHLF